MEGCMKEVFMGLAESGTHLFRFHWLEINHMTHLIESDTGK